MENLYDVAVRLIEQYRMLSPDDTVIVGCSGGADSVALLHLMCRLKREIGLHTVVAAHVQHGLRGEQAEQDAAFVRELAQRWGCVYEEARPDVRAFSAQNKLGLEEAGRQIRYAFFARLADKYPHSKIVTAHTRSDVAETILFRLARGTGSAGLCGIPAVRGNISRPLLNCSRQQVTDYLQTNALQYREDSSNADLSFSRNRIRHAVIPQLKALNPQCEAALARTAQQMQQLEEYMSVQAKHVAQQCEVSPDKDVFLRRELLQHPPIVRTYLWRRCLMRLGVEPESRWIAQAEHLLMCEGRTDLPSGKSIRSDKRKLYFENASFLPETILERCNALIDQINEFSLYCIGLYSSENTNVHNLLENFRLDRDKIEGKLFFRGRLPGDVFAPAGRGVCKTLKKLFNEYEIPVQQRMAVPLLCDERGIVYIPGIGCAQRVCVSEKTTHILWGSTERHHAE